MKPTTILWCAAILAVACAAAPPSPQETERLAAARALLARDPDAALLITDDLLKARPDWRDARLVAGEGSLALTKVEGSARADLLLADAERNFERALDLDDNDAATWSRLAEVRFQLGRFVEAKSAALRAANLFGSSTEPAKKGAPPPAADRPDALVALRIAALSAVRDLVAVRQAEIAEGQPDSRGIVKPGPKTAALAQEAFALLDRIKFQYPSDAYRNLSMACAWLGQDAQAIQALEQGIRVAPKETALHQELWRLHHGRGDLRALDATYAQLVREQPGIPVLLWFQGFAQRSHANQLRSQGNFQGAVDTYRKAIGSYGQYAAMAGGKDDATQREVGLAELGIARTLVDLADLDGAQRHLFAAGDASASLTDYDGLSPAVADELGTHYAGVVFAIHRALAESGADSLQRTLAFNEAVIQRHPRKWGFVYNNAALPARDLGVQIVRDRGGEDRPEAQRQQALAEANELWERSYRYYNEAVELSPDDPRIVNDCGLMLIYHLHRDFDRARALFERAIEIGEAQLAELPADTPQQERELLEEAVGDAWQNIAVLLATQLNRPFAEYQRFCEQAVRFYPYQRREAAAMLRNQGMPQAGSLSRGQAAGAAANAAQGGAAEKFAKVRAQAEPKAKEGDYDGALSVLDGAAKDLRDHAPYLALRGEYLLRFARQGREQQAKGVDFLFEDAASTLKRAVELDSEPAGPRQLLAEALYDKNDMQGAAATASSLLLHLQSQGGGKQEQLDAVHLVRANAAARAYTQAKQDGKDAPELLADARTSFRQLEQRGKLDAALLQTWSGTEQWAGAPAEAVNIYARAVQRSPDDQALLHALVQTAAAQEQAPLAVEALQKRSDPTGLWYLGWARYLAATELRGKEKTKEAQAELDAAKTAFERSMAGNAGYRDSCEQWIAMCLGQKGNIAFWSNDMANAEQWLLAAARVRPDKIGEDLGLGETTKLAILRVADKHLKANDLAKVEAIYRAASDAANGDLDLLNNAGLFARDYGNQLERAGKKQEAMEMYEQSYKAYSRACQLDPGNVRLRNDRALIAIYHLERDWELSKELLDAAIADGERTLQNSPPSDRQDRENLEEAIGDCYENLALWHLKHSKDGAAAKAAATRSQDYYPGARRPGARRHLQAAERLLKGQ